jgi:hypothetical protein
LACNVSVQSAIATQVASGAAVKILVAGTVLDCAKNPPNPQRPSDEVWVDVTVSVLVNGQPDPNQTASVTAILTPPPLAGVAAPWSVEAKGLPPVTCGGLIRVRAACHTDSACVSEVDIPVDCGCPDVTFDVAVAAGCNADGTRTATFAVTLTPLPPAGTPVVGTIHLGDGVAGSGVLPVLFPGPEWTTQGNVATGAFTFNYQPGTYPNVSFETTFPTACAVVTPLPAARLPLQIGACSRTDCPTAVTLEVRNAAGAVVATGDGAPCLPAGDYTITATSPAATGRVFTWSVDNQVDASPGVNGVNRNNHQRTIAAGSQTTISVSVATQGCEETPAGSVDLRACGAVRPPPPRPPPLCEIARIGGLALFIIGCVLIFAGFCTGNASLSVLGGVLAVAGLVVLALWAAFCAPFSGGCLLLQRLIEGLELVAIVLPIIAAILAAIGMYPCGIGVVIDWGLVGTLLAILNRIFRATPCQFQ